MKNAIKDTKTLVLIILDGFGLRADTKANAIASAHTPVLNSLLASAPNAAILASGEAVGLPTGQMGNSEVGHLTIGAGRIIEQDLSRISKAIHSGAFDENLVLKDTFQAMAKKKGTVHLLGLLSEGGVHSHMEHLFAAIKMAKNFGVKNLSVHAFLDGRDTPPKSAMGYIEKLESILKVDTPNFKIASLCGRYFAMDRDKRYERTKLCYELLTEGKAKAFVEAKTALLGLSLAYERGESDEFVKPTWIEGARPVEDGDVVLFMNFRADRARQLTAAFIDPKFSGFERNVCPKLFAFLSLTEYSKDLATRIIFPTNEPQNTLGEILERACRTQLRIAETEKYAHVTFFLNGGRETSFKGEERILIPSPKVATYDLKPEMSANEITEHLVKVISEQRYDFIVCNFANADMLGHTGNFEAAKKSIEVLDSDLGRILEALKRVKGEIIITADHGNAECMFDEKTGQAHTAHTTSLVPFIYVGRKVHLNPKVVFPNGFPKENSGGNVIQASPADPQSSPAGLRDIAPTILYLLDLQQPPEMEGQPLVVLD